MWNLPAVALEDKADPGKRNVWSAQKLNVTNAKKRKVMFQYGFRRLIYEVTERL